MFCGHRCNMVCHKGECGTGENCKKKIVLRCPCKRLKKETQCFMQLKNTIVLSCDSECIKLQESLVAQKLETDLKLKEIEKMQQEKELQEFLRKSEGKKRKKKKNFDEDNISSTFPKYFVILSSLIVSFFGFCLFYMFG